VPSPSAQQVLIKVIACGVCRTDLHILDGELAHSKLPLVIGHEIVGVIVIKGVEVTKLEEGDIVGVPWLGYTCGKCKYCLQGKENLCDNALFTGYTMDGGYANTWWHMDNIVFSWIKCMRMSRALRSCALV
jgi:propanol-preferring alcohol dehydrogenase